MNRKSHLFAATMTLWCSLAPAAFGEASESLFFGEPGGWIEMPAKAIPANSTRFTVECRFKVFTPSKKPVRLLARWNDLPVQKSKPGKPATPRAEDPERSGFYLGLGSSGEVVFGARNAMGDQETVSGYGLKRNTAWHHVAASWNEGRVTIFIDGKEARKTTFSKVTDLGTINAPLVIGKKVASEPAPRVARSPFFEGFISDIAVWSIARDQNALAATIDKPLSGKESGLVAYFPLHDMLQGPLIMGLPTGVSATISEDLGRLGWWDIPAWTEPAPAVPKDVSSAKFFTPVELTMPPQPATGQTARMPAMPANAPRFIVANDKTNQAGVVWQDPKSKEVYVTWVGKDLSTLSCFPLPLQDVKSDLTAVAWGPEGTLYYLLLEPKPTPRPENEPGKAALYRVQADGKLLNEASVDLKPGAFNWWFATGRCHMAYANGSLALHLPRTMCNGNPNGEGIHHQASMSAIYSEDLSSLTMLGNPSSHSFGSILAATSSRDALGLELGDCFPRAMQLHRISGGTRQSKIIHNYKANLITINKETEPMEVCHDANTYTELGGVVEGAQCYSVFFSTDGSPKFPVLDFSLAGKKGVPRNLAMMRVSKDFDQIQSYYDVQDEMVVPGAIPAAPVETGEFRNFTGELCKQRSTGLIWLTDYAEGEAAHAPHVIRRNNGTMLVLWEKTSAAPPGGQGPKPSKSLWSMTILESGRILDTPAQLAFGVSMDREEPIVRVGSRDFLLVNEGGRPKMLGILDP